MKLKKLKSCLDFFGQSIKALNQIFVIDACESGKANDIVSSVYASRASVLAKRLGVHVLLATTKIRNVGSNIRLEKIE